MSIREAGSQETKRGKRSERKGLPLGAREQESV